jgi:glycosyltransferase involved in cell wall biosynthesis
MGSPINYTLVGINFWPEPTGNAPYNTGLAEKLEKNGVLRVITGVPHYPWWRKLTDHSDSSFLRSHPRIFLTRINHFVPKRQSNLARAVMEIDFGLRAIVSGKVFGEKIILVSPAMLSSALVLAWVRIFSRRSKVLLWVQDLYEQGLEETTRRRGLSSRIVVGIENWLLSKVDRVVVAHPSFLDVKNLDSEPKKYSALANWSHFEFLPSESTHTTRQRYGFGESNIVLHIGNMGVKQGLEHVLFAAQLAQKKHEKLRFVFVGGGNQIEKLKEFVLENSLTNVLFLEPVTDEELSNLMNSADVLLVHEAPGVKEMSIPSKLSTYFLTSRPVLVCSEPDSLAGKTVQDSGTGLWVKSGDEAELIQAIERLLLQETDEMVNCALLFSKKHLDKTEALEKFQKILDQL